MLEVQTPGRQKTTVQYSPSNDSDPLGVLRRYRALAPWNIRDLSAMAGAILSASGVRPINAAATARPNERTIRFYVTRGLVSPPDGRGTSAIYHYRHLLQVLFIKLRQMEGANLDLIGKEVTDNTGDVLERRVSSVLGTDLPVPEHLKLGVRGKSTTGRSARATRNSLDKGIGEVWARINVEDGLELNVAASHPLASDPELLQACVQALVDRAAGQGND